MEVLLSSDVLREEYVIGTRRVRLGEVVRRAKVDSALAAADWNDLSEIERTFWVVAALFALRAEVEIVYDQ